jgi:UDP-glucose 4-epimerase
MVVYGADYDTRDGSCIRDFIHVNDIAHAHTLSIEFLKKSEEEKSCRVYNLGTGNGVTVLEAINSFEKISGVKLNYEVGPRRPGDVIAIYANNDLAKKELGWDPQFSLDQMMETAWKWEKRLKADDAIFGGKPAELN